MEFTPFAGLTALDEDDPITLDGGSFLTKNPRITDTLLKIGAVTHRHDAHRGLPNPSVAMTGTVIASAGSLAGASDFAVTYTIVDAKNGETMPAPPLVLSTAGQLAAPSISPSAGVSSSAGIMPEGNYFYGITYTDGDGGETTLGPTTLVTIPPGLASAEVLFTGLAQELSPNGRAINWRLWRSYEGADWHLVFQSGLDTFTDAGFDPPDNPARPPDANTSLGTSSLAVRLPAASADAAIAAGSAINIYLAPDTGFSEPCFYLQLPITAAGTTILITSETISQGSPPHVSTSLPGANQIFPDTDLVFGVKSPVDTPAELPSGSHGDVRIAISNKHIYGVLGAAAAGPQNWTDLTEVGVGVDVTGPTHGSAWVAASAETFPPGVIGDFATFAGEGTMCVGSGLLTTCDPNEVRVFSVHGDGAAPFDSAGDKYCYRWTRPGQFASGARCRIHYTGLGRYGTSRDGDYNLIGNVMHMTTASAGLAFWMEKGGDVGWTTDLTKLGTVQAEVGNHTGGQDLVALEATRVAQYAWNQNPTDEDAEVWVDIWRDGNTAHADIYESDPAVLGTQPVFRSTFDTTSTPYVGTSPGYFGFTFDYLGDQQVGIAELDILEIGEVDAEITLAHELSLIFTGDVQIHDGGPLGAIIEIGSGGTQAPPIGLGGSAGVPLIDPLKYVEFDSGTGASALVTDMGGGSARVTISATPGPQGASGTAGAQGVPGAGVAAGGSGKVPFVSPLTYQEFTASADVNLAVQDLGGGSARVVIGTPGTIRSAIQASGYTFQASDVATVVESPSGSGAVGYIVDANTLPVGAVIEVFQNGTGQVQIVKGPGVTLRSDGNKVHTNGQNATIGLRQRVLNEIVLSGDLA